MEKKDFPFLTQEKNQSNFIDNMDNGLFLKLKLLAAQERTSFNTKQELFLFLEGKSRSDLLRARNFGQKSFKKLLKWFEDEFTAK